MSNIIKYPFLFVFAFALVGCGAKKKVITKKTEQEQQEEVITPEIEATQEEETTTTPIKTNAQSTQDYVNIFSDFAQDEMRKYGIPASITLAQGILESGSGKGRLAVEANNHFGIKCHDWTGATIYHDDDTAQECFRKYNNVKYSYRDHSLFLTSRKRYMNLFRLGKDDYKAWAKELKKAGYATDRKYPQKLISLIERYELYKYDAEVLGKEESKAKDLIVANDKHTVKKGDTLYSLSRKYKITVKQIKDLNGLENSDLFVGQVLYVKPLPKDY